MITTYFVTHSLGRAATCTADADAVVDRINAVTASNGDSLHRDRVQAELDALIDAETQKLYGITIHSEVIEIDE